MSVKKNDKIVGPDGAKSTEIDENSTEEPMTITGSTLNELFSRLDNIQTNFSLLSQDQRNSQDRISQIEESTGGVKPQRNYLGQAKQVVKESVCEIPPQDQTDNHECQSDYQAIRDSVNRVKLPGTLTLGEASIPLKGEARGKVAFLKKSAG